MSEPKPGTNPGGPGRSVAERLDVLERENAALKKSLKVRTWAGAACLGLAVIAGSLLTAAAGRDLRAELLSSAQALPAIIEARGFVVKDRAGKVRVTLGKTWDPSGYPTGHPVEDTDEEAGLRLWVDGKQRGSLTVDNHGWGILTFTDAAENNRLNLLGEGVEAGLTIYDKRGDQRLHLSVDDDGSPVLVMDARKEKTRVQLGLHGSGHELPFFDVFDGKEEIHPFIGENGVPLAGGGTR